MGQNCTLNDVADFFEENNWIQGSYQDHEGGFCLVGGIGHMGCSDASQRNLFGELSQRINRHGLPMTIVAWNDAPGRTKEEVIALLRGE